VTGVKRRWGEGSVGVAGRVGGGWDVVTVLKGQRGGWDSKAGILKRHKREHARKQRPFPPGRPRAGLRGRGKTSEFKAGKVGKVFGVANSYSSQKKRAFAHIAEILESRERVT